MARDTRTDVQRDRDRTAWAANIDAVASKVTPLTVRTTGSQYTLPLKPIYRKY